MPYTYVLGCLEFLKLTTQCAENVTRIYNLEITLVGQAATHLPQLMHLSGSTTGSPFCIEIALTGHVFTQISQRVQATEQDLTMPASSKVLLHTTATL